jgi:glycogen debranching enzyme
MGKLVDQMYARASEVLKGNAVEKGLRTSLAYYNQIWARDAFISFLGANTMRDEKLLKLAKTTVSTFAKTASPMGQIANFYDLVNNSPEYGFSGSTDSTCWYIIGLASLFHATDDRILLGEPMEAAISAFKWLRYQDANNTWLIDSPPGADWMDAAVQRAGKTLYINTLFLIAVKCIDTLLQASGDSIGKPYALDFAELKQRFTDVFLPDSGSPGRVAGYWPRLSGAFAEERPLALSQKYYLQYISFSRIDTRFDTMPNLLCILSGLANTEASLSVLATMNSRRLSKPYPTRVLDPPYRGEGASFDRAFDSSLPVQHQSGPYAYHNGGVWPFVGGMHVAALYQMDVANATAELENLAKANALCRSNEKVGFNEWIHAKTGEPLGQFGQSWSAGMFIGAVQASKGSRMLGFLSQG